MRIRVGVAMGVGVNGFRSNILFSIVEDEKGMKTPVLMEIDNEEQGKSNPLDLERYIYHSLCHDVLDIIKEDVPWRIRWIHP